MPRFSQVFVSLAASCVVLSGCAREADTFRPRIFITSPEAGTVSRQASTIVRGYAMDDEGISEVLVNGRRVSTTGSGKIAAFQFRTSVANDRTNYVIKATDTRGQAATLDLPLRFDPVAPTLDVTKFEREGNTMRVTGTATDDVKVSSISVDGSRLTITPGRQVPFYAEATGIYVDIVVTDAAGNRLARRLR